jgi:hypothetical protein
MRSKALGTRVSFIISAWRIGLPLAGKAAATDDLLL